MIIQVSQSNLCWACIGELNKSFPNFSFLEDQDLDNFSILTEQLIEVVMGNYVAELVVDTYQ